METMIITNRAQLAAAIKSVDLFTDTIITSINEASVALCRYKFPAKKEPVLIAERNVMERKHARRMRKLARSVMKTPAAYWR